jgi:hypothetical protein
MTTLKIVAVVLVGISLLAQGWMWRQLRRDGGDTSALVPLFTLCISMLIGVLPGLLWPGNEPVQIGGSVVSMALTSVALVLSMRRILDWRRREAAK